MAILISPTISTISINGHVYTHADWENNTPGVLGGLGNDIASKIALLDAVGVLTKSISGNTILSGPESANLVFIFGGALTADVAVTFAAGFEGLAIIDNQTTGGHTLTCGLGTGTPILIPYHGSATVMCDGANFTLVENVVRTESGAKVYGDFAITGTGTFPGALFVGNTTVGGTLIVSGDTEIDGTLTGVSVVFSGTLAAGVVNSGTDVIAAGVIDGASLNITGHAGVGEQLDVGHRVHIYGGVDPDGPADSEAWIHLDTTSLSASCWLYLTVNETLRWVIGKNLETEAGSNTGSNFAISRFADDGSALGDSMIIHRDSGNIILPNLPTSTSGLVAGTLWNNGGVLSIA